MAFLVLLDSMTPAERVAFILHDVFGYPFAEIAEILGRSSAACRQLATSARRRLRTSRAPTASVPQQASMVRAFKQAWEARDINRLIGLLDPEAMAIGDGGGVASAALQPIAGAELVARFFAERAGAIPGSVIEERTVNGQPGLVVQVDGTTVSVLAFDIAGDRIRHVWAVLNPRKLGSWSA